MYKTSKNGCVYLYQLQSLLPEIPMLPIFLKQKASSKFVLENLNGMFYSKNILKDLAIDLFFSLYKWRQGYRSISYSRIL